MNIRPYIFWLLIIIISLFLLWQLLLITITVRDLLIGIPVLSFNIELNKTREGGIPRIIHQMWKTKNLLTYPIQNSHSQWKQFYPNYKIRLWTDEDIEDLISQNESLYKIYQSYSYAIQRADLARLILIYHEGGIYVDLDVYPTYNNIENLRSKNASLIIGRSSTDICLVNHFIMGEKHSPILNYIIDQIDRKSFLKRIFLLPYLEVFSTGSIFLTNIIRKRIRLVNPEEDRLIILSKNQLSEYISHDAGRSWHLFDGYLINKIDAYPKTFFAFFLLSIFCCIKFRKLSRKFI